MERVIERIEALAAALGDETTATLAHEIAEQLPSGELNVLVVGQFKRGKSSLINALLRADVMPTGALPVTGVATAIRFGRQGGAAVFFRQRSAPQDIRVDDLPLYVTEQHNPANCLGVERVEVLWPSEAIRGLALFDTPGIGSTYTHNTAAARATLPRADAAILVVGPEPPIGAEEIQYARDVVAASEYLFVVLNKSDLAGEALPEILEFTREAVEQAIGHRQDLHVVPMSATRARDAQNVGAEDASFAGFTSSLRKFVERQGDATRERSIRRRVLVLVARLDTLLTMRSAVLGLPGAERESRKELVKQALQMIDDRVRLLELTVDDDIRRICVAAEEAMDAFYERDEPRFRSLAMQLSAERSGQMRSERVERAVAERAEIWRKDAASRASQQLERDAAKYGRLLGEVEASALEAGCDVLQIDASTLTPRSIEFAPAKVELVSSLTPTTGLEIIISNAIELMPSPLRKLILRRHYDDLLARALDALRGKMRYAISRDLEPWRRSARITITSVVANVRRAVLNAFDKISTDAVASEEDELRYVGQLQRELLEIRTALEDEHSIVAS